MAKYGDWKPVVDIDAVNQVRRQRSVYGREPTAADPKISDAYMVARPVPRTRMGPGLQGDPSNNPVSPANVVRDQMGTGDPMGLRVPDLSTSIMPGGSTPFGAQNNMLTDTGIPTNARGVPLRSPLGRDISAVHPADLATSRSAVNFNTSKLAELPGMQVEIAAQGLPPQKTPEERAAIIAQEGATVRDVSAQIPPTDPMGVAAGELTPARTRTYSPDERADRMEARGALAKEQRQAFKDTGRMYVEGGSPAERRFAEVMGVPHGSLRYPEDFTDQEFRDLGGAPEPFIVSPSNVVRAEGPAPRPPLPKTWDILGHLERAFGVTPEMQAEMDAKAAGRPPLEMRGLPKSAHEAGTAWREGFDATFGEAVTGIGTALAAGTQAGSDFVQGVKGQPAQIVDPRSAGGAGPAVGTEGLPDRGLNQPASTATISPNFISRVGGPEPVSAAGQRVSATDLSMLEPAATPNANAFSPEAIAQARTDAAGTGQSNPQAIADRVAQIEAATASIRDLRMAKRQADGIPEGGFKGIASNEPTMQEALQDYAAGRVGSQGYGMIRSLRMQADDTDRITDKKGNISRVPSAKAQAAMAMLEGLGKGESPRDRGETGPDFGDMISLAGLERGLRNDQRQQQQEAAAREAEQERLKQFNDAAAPFVQSVEEQFPWMQGQGQQFFTALSRNPNVRPEAAVGLLAQGMEQMRNLNEGEFAYGSQPFTDAEVVALLEGKNPHGHPKKNLPELRSRAAQYMQQRILGSL